MNICIVLVMHNQMNLLICYCGRWKENRKKYPILHRISKNILACPPSTVAIELAFSVGRRILDDKRAALTPNTIKVLICLKDWRMKYNRSQDQPRPEDNEDENDQFV